MSNKKEKILQAVFLAVLLLYPLRHITWGLDLWDTGYNYANFQYMGLQHMDSMWLFSTYLATAAGHFLTKLPFAGGLVGMNFYTGLFASLLAITGYLFCTKKLGIKPWIAFLGEMTALSLCWCPTALLYNYLTYVLFLFCVIFLYKGLYEKKMWFLFAAGICLGSNVFVRFSNLPEAAMIAAVWAYAVIEGLERRRAGAAHGDHAGQKGSERNKSVEQHKAGGFRQAFSHTLWCLGGYLAALLVFGGYIHLRYGLGNYIAGIQRLFGMTENAPDYTAKAMLMKIFGTYVENFYWVMRICAIAIAGILFFAVAKVIVQMLPLLKKNMKFARIFMGICYGVWAGVSLASLVWMYQRLCSFKFYSYDSMLRPSILFLMLTMFIAVIRIFRENAPKQEKLMSGMVLLVVLLTSIGSNNGVYPSINNLFVAAPYTFWQSYLFFVKVKEYRPKAKKLRWLTVSAFPVKGVLAAFLTMVAVQVSGFGILFAFAESTGVQNVTAKVENNEVLRGVRMDPRRAQWMTEITAYAEEAGLQGREVILYGNIPGLSFYLQMPSAFNPWSDLDSYNIDTMREALALVRTEIGEGRGRPVIIVENQYVQYDLGGEEALIAMGVGETQMNKITSDQKWLALKEFMEEQSYEKTFFNEKFTIWE